MVFIPTLCSTCGSELQALKLNLYLGICIFFSATFCLVTLQNTDLASDTCNTGTGTGRRRDRTALQSPWKSVPCQFRWMGRKRQRIQGVVESSESAFWSTRGGGSSGPAGCSFPASPAAVAELAPRRRQQRWRRPSAADGESIRSLYDTAIQGPFLPAGRRPCEGRAARNGVPAASPARTIRAPEQPHPLTRGAIQWPAIGGGSGQRR